MKDGKIVGAVGVSGSSVEHDIKVAEAAVKAFEELYDIVNNKGTSNNRGHRIN